MWHVTVNARVIRITPRYKVIRYKKQFSEAGFRENFTQLPFEVVNALEGHEPLKCVRVTTPPAPWLNDPNIWMLQRTCKCYHRKAHTPPHTPSKPSNLRFLSCILWPYMWHFTQLGGLSRFHTLPIFTVLAVKVRKIFGMWVKFL